MCWPGKLQMQGRKVAFKVTCLPCNPVMGLGLAVGTPCTCAGPLRSASSLLGHLGALVSPCNIFLREDT